MLLISPSSFRSLKRLDEKLPLPKTHGSSAGSSEQLAMDLPFPFPYDLVVEIK